MDEEDFPLPMPFVEQGAVSSESRDMSEVNQISLGGYEGSSEVELPLTTAYILHPMQDAGFVPSSEIELPDYSTNFPPSSRALEATHRVHESLSGKHLKPCTTTSTHLQHSPNPSRLGQEAQSLLGPQQQRTPRSSQRCIRCWALRKKCEETAFDTGDLRCIHCIKFDIPPYVCSRERVTQYRPFEKWKDATYELLFTNVTRRNFSTQKIVQLQHYGNGPILIIKCCQFHPTETHQIHVLRKDSCGWHSTETTAYCLVNNRIDVSSYVEECVEFALKEACRNQHPVYRLFELVCFYQGNPIIRDCMQMYTTLRLISIGWRFCGNETLGMTTVTDESSAWYGTTPVPRMIQNQLGHLLELQLIELDKKVLSAIHRLLEKRKRCTWVVATLATFLLLHIRELDAGRNIYWWRYKDAGGFWIHPSEPAALIEEEITSCNSLLWHYHCAIGQEPLNMNWDSQRAKNMVDNDNTIMISMKALQAYARLLKRNGLIAQKAADVYRDGDPSSVSLTVSSLVFANLKNGCMVTNFY